MNPSEDYKMKRGKNEVETLNLNGWGVGDVLEGYECGKPMRIKIKAVGVQEFICQWDRDCSGEYDDEQGNTTLSCREWYKVGHEPQWRGPEDGLPPIGTVCKVEVWITSQGWAMQEHEYRIDFIGRRYVIATIISGKREVESCFIEARFYPIKSDRERAIEAGCEIANKPEVSSYNVNIECSAAVKAVIEALVDAGWKPPQEPTK